ncbi:IS1182-like element ISMac1 family transposase [soil metagenome]
MAYNLIPCGREQPFLLPPSLDDWLLDDHLARFVIDVVDQLDLGAFYHRRREDGWGRAAYDPKMKVALLLYAYCTGVRSSREIERRLREDLAFRFIAANRCPDHATVARFRADHDELLAGLFLQALRLCAQAGLVRVGMVALDGKRVKANASMAANKTRAGIEAEVKAMLAEAAQTDAAEDAVLGECRGDELPPVLADRRSRLHRLRQAKASLDAEELRREQDYRRRLDEREAEEVQLGYRLRGRKPAPPEPIEAMPANVSDPDSRIMKTQHGFIQGYNGQVVVTAEQIVIAADLTDDRTDVGLLHPMIDQAQANLQATGVSKLIGVLVADAGYYSDANATLQAADGPELLIATAKGWRQRKAAQAHPPRGRIPQGFTTRQRMERKLQTKRGQRLYRKRSATVEPVFGQHDTRGLGRLHRRGLDPCRCEWIFENTAHNVLRLWRAGRRHTGSPTRRGRVITQRKDFASFRLLVRCGLRPGR